MHHQAARDCAGVHSNHVQLYDLPVMSTLATVRAVSYVEMTCSGKEKKMKLIYQSPRTETSVHLGPYALVY